MRRKLIITGGARERELQLVGRIVVGRDPGCELSHDDSLLSRRHAEFVTVGDRTTVRDLGSRNGVFVNGTRAVEHVLEPGDVVQIGPLRGQFIAEVVPVSVTPEEIDGDRTAMIRGVFGVAEADSPENDEDVTRMVPAPRMPVPGRAAASLDDGDAPTAFIPASEVPLPEPARPAAPAAAPDVSRTAIFVQVLAVVMIALATVMIPVSVGAAPIWFAIPFIVAFAGAYLVSASIHRRVSVATADTGRR